MTADPTTPKQTPLYPLHLELGAKMVPFAGYQMPLQYARGILAEHLHTREHAGLFDVSHMGQVRIRGRAGEPIATAAKALERLAPIDVVGLAPARQRYGVFTNHSGGILDDFMVLNTGRDEDGLLLVVNAARKQHDVEHLRQHLGADCEVEMLDARALLALQGPAAARVLTPLAPELAELRFMQAAPVTLQGESCWVSRSGYTGEDGFEISVPAAAAEALARELLASGAAPVAPVGLGARDSLRLEAGLCLYGHDIDETTTPVEAGLNWAIPKIRRAGGVRGGGFPGADVILNQLQDTSAVLRRRVGILPQGKAPVREGAELHNATGDTVGRVTSGGFGPSLGKPVAMGYVGSETLAGQTELATIELQAAVRGRLLPVALAKLPLVPARYYR